jgi:hypothetical protein
MRQESLKYALYVGMMLLLSAAGEALQPEVAATLAMAQDVRGFRARVVPVLRV